MSLSKLILLIDGITVGDGLYFGGMRGGESTHALEYNSICTLFQMASKY